MSEAAAATGPGSRGSGTTVPLVPMIAAMTTVTTMPDVAAPVTIETTTTACSRLVCGGDG